MNALVKDAGTARIGELFELLVIAAHRLAVEVDAAVGFERVSMMGLVALLHFKRVKTPMTAKVLAATLGSSRPSATELVDWHRTERLWNLHDIGGPGRPARRPILHVR